MIEVFGIFFTFVVIFFIAAVFIYVLKSGNKVNEKQKNTQQLESSKKMGNLAAPAQYAVKKNQNLQNNQQTSKHAIIQPSLRDHLHGTTTQTSIENCKKNHFLNKNENFTTQSDIKCSIIIDEEDLEKLIVIGEAINNPAYKRKRR